MLSPQELSFARRYPFSGTAKRVLKEFDLSLDELPPEVLTRARAMLRGGLEGKYAPEIMDASSILKDEILAFPVAKILLSLMDRQEFYQRFAKTFADNFFDSLQAESDEALFDLASEFRLRYDLPDQKTFFASLPVFDYLKTTFAEDFMKLVNQRIDKGRIFLTRNEFARLLSRLAYTQLVASLPLDVKEMPVSLKNEAKTLCAQLDAFRFKSADFKPSGQVKPEFFPPCMANIYSQLLSGRDVPHFGRFDIATFLLGIGMPAEEVMALFKHAPDYDERVTRYQVERLAGQKGGTTYTAPGCEKIKAHGFCPLAQCDTKHPVTYYKKEFMRAQRAQRAAAKPAPAKTPEAAK